MLYKRGKKAEIQLFQNLIPLKVFTVVFRSCYLFRRSNIAVEVRSGFFGSYCVSSQILPALFFSLCSTLIINIRCFWLLFDPIAFYCWQQAQKVNFDVFRGAIEPLIGHLRGSYLNF